MYIKYTKSEASIDKRRMSIIDIMSFICVGINSYQCLKSCIDITQKHGYTLHTHGPSNYTLPSKVC